MTTATQTKVPPLKRPEQWLLGIVGALSVTVGGLGLGSSFQAVSAAGARWGFAAPWMLPVGIDVAIPVFTAAYLLLIRTDMPLGWVRFVPWSLTAVTCWLNIAAGHSASAKLAHGTMPLLWVVLSEIAAHVYATRIGAVTGRRMEKIRRSRWMLAPLTTFALWRRMTLWEITSYSDALARERDRQLARAALRETYGRRWRAKAPVRDRVLFKLGELSPANFANQSMSDVQESAPAALSESADLLALEPAVSTLAAAPTDPVPVARPVAATTTRRRATGRVPKSARSPRPIRTAEELLEEGRKATDGWSDADLTAEAIRKALRTAPAKARIVRDALRAERATGGEG